MLAQGCGGSDAVDLPEPPAAAPDAQADGDFEAARAHAFQLHEDRADPELVLESLLAARALRPDAFGVNRRLGEISALLGQDELALASYQAAAEVHPDDRDVALGLLTLYVRLGQIDAARALLPRLLDDTEIEGEALLQQALLFDYEGHRELALATVERASRLDPESAAPCLALHGRFLFEAGDYTQAAERFAAALAGRPGALDALKGLADSLRRQGREPEARHWDEVLRLMLVLQDDEHIRRRPKLRRETLEALTALHPQWALGWRQLAGQQQRDGDDQAACQTIERYLELHGSQVDAETTRQLRERFCP